MTQVGIMIELALLEWFHTLVMTEKARLQNSLLLFLKRRWSRELLLLLLLKRRWRWSRELKISLGLVRDWLQPRCRGGLTRPG